MNTDEAQQIASIASLLPSDYRVEQLLGQGGSGQVYRAFHKTLEKYVAVKILAAESLTDSERQTKLLLKEAKALSALDHQNIVKVMSRGTAANGSLFLVYEFLEGETLQSILNSRAEIPEKFLSMLCAQICEALDYVHARSIVHRDIKPGNIMVLPSESRSLIHVKLIDFGLAKDIAAGLEGAATGTSSHCGSPAYMSPEQCLGKSVDSRSDIYSFACVVYECLLGKPPFDGETVYDVLYQQINLEAAFPDKKLSAALRYVLKKALSKDPALRYGSAGEFNEALQKVLKLPNASGVRRKVFISTASVAVSAAGLLLLAGSFHYHPKNVSDEPPAKPASTGKRIPRKLLGSTLRPFMLLEEASKRASSARRDKDRRIIIKDLNEFLPKLKTAEELFIAYDIIADQYLSLGDTANADKFYRLEFAQAKLREQNGRLPIDAAKSLVFLAYNSFLPRNYADIEPRLRQALKIFLENKDSCYRLAMPFEYNCMKKDEIYSVAHSMLADIAVSRKNLKLAEEYERAGMAGLAEPYRETMYGRPYQRLADFLWADHQESAAIQNIEAVWLKAIQRADVIPKFADANAEASELFHCGVDTAIWLFKHHQFERVLEVKEGLEHLLERFPSLDSKYTNDRELQQIFADSAKGLKRNGSR